MFTGLIQAVGSIEHIEMRSGDMRVSIAVNVLDMSDTELGASIAVNGVCLTAVEFNAQHFIADVSVETLSVTCAGHWKVGQPVNLEKALLPTTRLGGHLVSGHVDGIAEVLSRITAGRAEQFVLRAPKNLARYIAQKGSVCVDGVSLTVNGVEGEQFSLTIVPHTLEQTTIRNWRKGSKVNIEVDLLARYLERLLNAGAVGDNSLTAEKIMQAGFTRSAI